MTNQITYRNSLFWLISILTLLITGFLCYLNLSEYINSLQNPSDYPFGGEGPTPFYYQSAEMYSIVCLTFGFLFLIAFGLSAFAIIKTSKRNLLISFFAALVLIFSQIMLGQIS